MVCCEISIVDKAIKIGKKEGVQAGIKFIKENISNCDFDLVKSLLDYSERMKETVVIVNEDEETIFFELR